MTPHTRQEERPIHAATASDPVPAPALRDRPAPTRTPRLAAVTPSGRRRESRLHDTRAERVSSRTLKDTPLRKAGGAARAVAPGEGRRTSVDQKIYDSVYDAVMSHRLPPGTKLSEVSLCDLFHVSRTVVRKALQRLAHEHIVELRPNRGASIASPTPSETREIFAARRAIEAAIVPLVVEHAGKNEIARLRRHTRSEQKALERNDRSTWIRLTGEFHLVMAEAGGNAVLTSFLSELVSRCSLIIAIYDSPTSVPCATSEHDALIDAIEERRTVDALAMMNHHLASIEARLALSDEREEVDLASILVTD